MKVKVCLIQDNPVFFDIEKTIDKVESLTIKYAAEGVNLIVFPESFIPGYPRGFSFGAVIGSRTKKGRELYAEYHNNSLNINSSYVKRLEQLCKDQNVYLVIGATESQDNNGSLYCSMLYLSPTDGLLGVHRKIKPTGSERLIWAEASGESLVSFKTQIGKLGGLICWENYMPMARFSMYKQGVEIYIAPTADSRDEWIATMQHIALEGRCFVLGCNQYITKSHYPDRFKKIVVNEPEVMCRGGSVIVSPLGKIISGPLFNKSGALIAELELNEILESKLDFDTVGHYNRNDIFKLDIIDQPNIIVEKSQKNIT